MLRHISPKYVVNILPCKRAIPQLPGRGQLKHTRKNVICFEIYIYNLIFDTVYPIKTPCIIECCFFI